MMKRVLCVVGLLSTPACIIDAPHYVLPEDHVAGTLHGLWSGATLHLRLQSDGVDEPLDLTTDGDFAFSGVVADGQSFTVTVDGQPDHHQCDVMGGNAQATDVDIHVDVLCTGPTVDVALSAPFAWTFDPSLLSQSVDVSVLTQQTSITVTAPDATQILVGGTAVLSGQSFPAPRLNLGANTESVEVHVGALSRTYALTINRDGAAIAQGAYAKASNTDAGDRFGYAVAASGDTIVVGAPYEASNATGVGGVQTNNSAPSSGAVYVFRRAGGTWSQEAYIKADRNTPGSMFGWSVAIDGDVLAVGAPFENSGSVGVNPPPGGGTASASGAVFVFRRTGSNWSQEAYIKASNTGAGDWFGYTVALNGSTLGVGAIEEASAATGIDGNQSSNTAQGAGAVYVFVHGGTWSQQAYVKESNTDSQDFFGSSIAISGDTMVVGSVGEAGAVPGVNGDESNNGLPESGAAYVFTRNGTAWSQQAYIKASNPQGGAHFGWSVSIFGDRLAVGAPQEPSLAATSGATYVFDRTGSQWSQTALVKASNADAMDGFGTAIAVSPDLLAVGAPAEDSQAVGVGGDATNNGAQNSGAAYLFRWNGSTFVQDTYVKASNTDAGDTFGTAVSLGEDALIVAAPNESGTSTGVGGDQSSNSAASSGAVYVFR